MTPPVPSIPKQIAITNRANNATVPCQLERLTVQLATNRIDNEWWTDVQLADQQKQTDRQVWEPWNVLVASYPQNYNECLAIVTPDGRVQAAVILAINGQASQGMGRAVVIHWLATAPWNRFDIPGHPRHRGCGEQIILHAAHLSYSLGLRGIVNCFALNEAESFYARQGFCETGNQSWEGLNEWELTEHEAEKMLRREGII